MSVRSAITGKSIVVVVVLVVVDATSNCYRQSGSQPSGGYNILKFLSITLTPRLASGRSFVARSRLLV
uniref:Putative secreted protein n=1 Tax=Anopheles darlingi TaxID=43151 RepID=A0A2M4D3F4_ANODA